MGYLNGEKIGFIAHIIQEKINRRDIINLKVKSKIIKKLEDKENIAMTLGGQKDLIWTQNEK